jgi:hypothetical protein
MTAQLSLIDVTRPTATSEKRRALRQVEHRHSAFLAAARALALLLARRDGYVTADTLRAECERRGLAPRSYLLRGAGRRAGARGVRVSAPTPRPPYFDFRHLHGRTVVVLVCPPAVVHDYRAPEHEPVGLPLGAGSTWCGLAAQGGGR